jgi:hypothetical protein
MARPACWRCPGGQRARRVSAATATSSRVAQSTLAKHQIHGPAWGHELPGYLAIHREVFQDNGYWSFGELASYAATQDPNNCPPSL